MNSISFMGFNNIAISHEQKQKKQTNFKNGNLVSDTNNISTKVIVECDLTDDKDGNHELDFFNTLYDTRNNTIADWYVYRNNPSHMRIAVKKISDSPDNTKTSLTLNEKELVCKSQETFSLFSYLKNLTRDMILSDKTSDKEKEYLKTVNQTIENEMNILC